MTENRKRFHWKTHRGESLYDGELSITPVAKLLSVRLPFIGFIWSYPYQVEITHGEEIRILPIVNLTRLAQISIYGIGLSLAVIAVVLGKRK